MKIWLIIAVMQTTWATHSLQFKYLIIFIYSLLFFTIFGYIMNSPSGQLPVGLIAQLVEHCTGIAEVMGSNPVLACSFFQALISQLLFSVFGVAVKHSLLEFNLILFAGVMNSYLLFVNLHIFFWQACVVYSDRSPTVHTAHSGFTELCVYSYST